MNSIPSGMFFWNRGFRIYFSFASGSSELENVRTSDGVFLRGSAITVENRLTIGTPFTFLLAVHCPGS